ncbi:Nramp family divalent metal transporter [Christensenellaceae bacterium NSJ-63]|uniref:Nramp family divalent metal transporter n=1 Tax=Guopingia tenuis TaxID=2763656 RepID=A0A926DIM8_9FIRM|nr:Nramp family divalent metal transporter [Guopingia tenuis]MBC8537765.1 Nramp family divalent metal transporter [Guopingia tenuis]
MSKFWQKLKNIGPGALVAAAFIGPGTVTTCTLSGASYGYTLLWAMLFSTIATIVFQEMASRVGIVTQMGLGEALRERYQHKKGILIFVIILVIAAIFIGNIAYETGNITGGAMGTNLIFSEISIPWWGVIVGAVALALLASGSYKVVEKILMALVIIMSVVFISTAIVSQPDWGGVLKGLFVPAVPNEENAWLTVAGLIGTTVVPYNIFLHCSASAQKWKDRAQIKTARWDAIISIGLGGIISMMIIIAAANPSLAGQEITSAGDMAKAMQPLLGDWAKYFFGIGIFSAGLTSAITAPLSAAFATSGILGWGSDMKKLRFKAIWMVVLAVGVVLAAVGLTSSPTEMIIIAQAANAVILPIIAILLTIVVNDKKLMGENRNGVVANILAIIVIGVTLFISARNLYKLFF